MHCKVRNNDSRALKLVEIVNKRDQSRGLLRAFVRQRKLVNHRGVELISECVCARARNRRYRRRYRRRNCFSAKERSRVIRGGSGCLVGPRGQGCTSAICELRSRYCSARRWAPEYKGGQRSFFRRHAGRSKSNRSGATATAAGQDIGGGGRVGRT